MQHIIMQTDETHILWHHMASRDVMSELIMT